MSGSLILPVVLWLLVGYTLGAFIGAWTFFGVSVSMRP